MTINEELKKELAEINDKYKKNDSLREEIIKISRDINKASKKAIYALHRGEVEESKKLISKAKELLKKSEEKIQTSNFDRIGSLKASKEEYIEAQCFYRFTTNGELPLKKELEEEFQLEDETYLGGLSDFTGELVRKAVLHATKKETEEVKKIYEVIEELYGTLIEFDFRTGDLRKKFDSIKYNLSKVETILYEISIRT